jgi:hypothetical protein
MCHLLHLDYVYTDNEVCSSETSVFSYQNTRRHNPPDQNTSLQLHKKIRTLSTFSFSLSKPDVKIWTLTACEMGARWWVRGGGVRGLTPKDRQQSYEIQGGDSDQTDN